MAKEYKPNPNRKEVDGRVFVSKEELESFKKKYGEDKTLRDLLNMDKGLTRRRGSTPSKVAVASRGMKGTAFSEEPLSVSSKSEAKKADIPKGKEKAPKSEGKDTSGPSALDRVLMPLAGAAGLAGVYKGARMATAASRARKAEQAAEASATKAAMEFGKGKAAQVTSDTGRRFTPKQEMEAAEAAVRGAASRKQIASKRAAQEKEVAEATARGAATRKELAKKREERALLEARYKKMLEAKDQAFKKEAKKPSPRSKTREESDVEFRKGGMAKKRK